MSGGIRPRGRHGITAGPTASQLVSLPIIIGPQAGASPGRAESARWHSGATARRRRARTSRIGNCPDGDSDSGCSYLSFFFGKLSLLFPFFNLSILKTKKAGKYYLSVDEKGW